MADPIVPVLPPQDGMGRTWHRRNIFVGPNGDPDQRFVPNVDDLVVDWEAGFFRVTYVDETTYLSTLLRWRDPGDVGGVAEEDVLLGAGPGTQSESYRIFHNNRVTPFTGAFDGRLRLYANRASYIRLYRGSDATGNGTVVSAIYDQNNQFVTNNIPLELVQSAEGENLAIKSPARFWITQRLDTGEPVTAVVYGTNDQPLSASRLLILNTENYMHGGAATKYITSIRLESHFMAAGEEALIQMPLNVPVQSALFMGVVQYSDGTSLTLPVDGSKFSLAGINSYIASELGERQPVRLIYRLSAEENGGQVQGNETHRFMDKAYQVETIQAKANYNVKLFSYPIWDDPSGRYVLRHYLTNLDRGEVWDVTGATTLHTTSPAFQPNMYGVEQNLVFVVNLEQVDSLFASFRHVTPISINLAKPGSQTGPKWTIRYTPGNPVYGADAIATVTDGGGTGTRVFDLSSNAIDQAEWVNRFFYATEPVFNPGSEALAPEPTHFVLRVNTVVARRPIGQWNDSIELQSGSVPQGSTVFVEFERDTGSEILKLGVAGLPVDVL